MANLEHNSYIRAQTITDIIADYIPRPYLASNKIESPLSTSVVHLAKKTKQLMSNICFVEAFQVVNS